MIKSLIRYILTFASFIVIDLIWLVLIANGIYRGLLQEFMTDSVRWGAAMIFYAMFIAACSVFVITPARKKRSWTQALVRGAFFGLVTYATYDLTNYATIDGWPLQLVFIDLAWGTFLTATVCTIGYGIHSRI